MAVAPASVFTPGAVRSRRAVSLTLTVVVTPASDLIVSDLPSIAVTAPTILVDWAVVVPVACANAGRGSVASIGMALASANPHTSLSEIVILTDPIKFLLSSAGARGTGLHSQTNSLRESFMIRVTYAEAFASQPMRLDVTGGPRQFFYFGGTDSSQNV